MNQFLKDPRVRLALRALLAGVAVLATKLAGSDHLDWAVLQAALVAAGWAAVEVFTPLNALVGKNKPPTS